MSAISELSEYTASGTIEMVHIVGVPRSVSTALGRAMNEVDVPSVYVNEPFNRENRDPEKAAHFILQTLSATKGEKLVVITKNMASYLDDESFALFASLSRLTIWSVRHPLIQMASLLTRIVNDMHVGPGEDEIAQDALGPYLDDACDFLEHSSKSNNFSKTGWEAIGRHAMNCTVNVRTMTVDGDAFTASPSEQLQSICTRAGLPYSDRMCHGWRSSFLNVINADNEQETMRSAWTNTAARSDGIVPQSRPALDMAMLPAAITRHIEEVATPVYEYLLNNKM